MDVLQFHLFFSHLCFDSSWFPMLDFFQVCDLCKMDVGCFKHRFIKLQWHFFIIFLQLDFHFNEVTLFIGTGEVCIPCQRVWKNN